jgi:Ca-activated chloride channel family protein
MIFLKPEYLWMMLIPSLILFYFIVTQKSALNLYFDEKVLKRLRVDNESLGKIGRNMMFFVALMLMIIALARPVKEKAEVTLSSKSIDIMVALDVSKSMMANDIYPHRLAFAKKRFMELLDSFKEANIGVVAFSSQGFLVSPMTQDTSTLKYLVNNLSLDSLSLKGTNLMIPIEKGNAFLKDSKEKIIIVFTDGGDGADFSKEIQKAKSYGESIYIYAVGTGEGGTIMDKGVSLKDAKGNIVITRRNDAIKALAFQTGGAYIEAGHQDNSISLMVSDIKKKFKMQTKKEKKVKEYRELFYYPLAGAVLFLLFAFHSLPRRVSALFVLGIMIGVQPPQAQARMFDFFEIDKADKAFEKGAYDEASKHYEKIVKSTKTPESLYDLANSQYKQGKYKEALKNYARIQAKSKELQYKKSFNSGNSHFQLKAYEKAIKAYEAAVKIQSDDEDAKYNLNLAKKKLEEKKKKEQEKKNQEQKNDKNKDKKKNDKKEKDKKKENKEEKDKEQQKDKNGKEKEEKKKKEEQKESEKQGDKQKQEASKEQEKMQQKRAKKEDISAKEERMWQQHLENNRPKTMPMKLDMKKIERKRDEKPW